MKPETPIYNLNIDCIFDATFKSDGLRKIVQQAGNEVFNSGYAMPLHLSSNKGTLRVSYSTTADVIPQDEVDQFKSRIKDLLQESNMETNLIKVNSGKQNEG